MAFIDNPTISALGASLGLSPLFAAAGSPTPEGDSVTTPPVRPGVSKPNQPEYRNRPFIPRNEMGSSGGVGPGGNQPVAPGVMDQATFQSPEVQKLLGQYGVHPTDTPPDPNLFVHNPEAFVKHPVLSGLLEHGLRGLAYSHPGANFLQSLAGGVRGIQEGDAASAQQENNQLTAPFQQAGMVADLQHKADEHRSADALIGYHTALAANASDKIANQKQRMALAIPRKTTSGQMETLQPDPDNPDELKWQVDDSLGRDEEMFNKNAYFSHALNAAALKHGGDPNQITDEEHATIAQGWNEMQSESKSAGARSVAKIPRTTVHVGGSGSAGTPGKFTDAQKAALKELDRQEAATTKALSTAQNGSIAHDDTGTLLVPGSTPHKAYLKKLQGQLQTIQSQRNSLVGGSTPSTETQPAAPSGNPFRQ
jgi:hypothetical protein